MSDDLVERLRDRNVCSLAHNSCRNDMACDEAADRIEELEQDLKSVLRREEDANRAAMKHLRALEQERIKSKNYADFNHEWRRRCEALERQVKAADALAEAVTHEREMACQDFDKQQDAAIAVDNALAAYRATKEGGA